MLDMFSANGCKIMLNRVMSIISYFVTINNAGDEPNQSKLDLDSITTDRVTACETLIATQNIQQTMTLTIPNPILLFVKEIGQEKWIPAQTLCNVLSHRFVPKGR
jgi:hypothetical protein